MTLFELVRNRLIQSEGFKLKPYYDSKGILTIGCGHNMENDPNPIVLTRGKIRKTKAYELLGQDIIQATEDAIKFIPSLNQHNKQRQLAIICMSFNMGYPSLSTFKKFKQLFINKEYKKAADEMLLSSDGKAPSKWLLDVGKRAVELAEIVEHG